MPIIIVEVKGPMVDTGIVVSSGDTLTFHCQGFVDQGDRFGHRIQVDGGGRKPDGSFEDDRGADTEWPLPGGRRYALIGMLVGPTGKKLFQIGSSDNPFTVDSAARLFVGANDDKPYDNDVIVGARQSPWRVSIDHDLPVPLVPSTPNIRIDAIQILQVAGPTSDGERILVGKKTTLVRAFLSVRLFGIFAVNGQIEVDGALPIAPLNPTGKRNEVQLRVPGADPNNPDLASSSLNFEVPGTLLDADANVFHHIFKVTVWIEGNQKDENGYHFTKSASAGFSPYYYLNIDLLEIIATVDGQRNSDPRDLIPGSPGVSHISSLIAKDIVEQLPLPDGGITFFPSGAFGGRFSLNENADTPDDYNFIVSEYVQWFGHGNIILGVLVPTIKLPFVGARKGKAVVAGLYQNTMSGTPGTGGYSGANSIVAHELGHVFELKHAGGCASPKDIDLGLPPQSGNAGWSTSYQSLVPSRTPALMSYCSLRWTTQEEYMRIYRRLRAWYGF